MEVYWLSIKDRRLKIEFEEARRLGGLEESEGLLQQGLDLLYTGRHSYIYIICDCGITKLTQLYGFPKPLGPESWRSLAQLLYTNERTLLQDPRR